MKKDADYTDSSDGLFRRWSQRKSRQQYHTEDVNPPVDDTAVLNEPRVNTPDYPVSTANPVMDIPAPDALPIAEQPEREPSEQELAEQEHPDEQEPLLTDADMPALDDIDATSDISCFFNAGVSETLRQAALKKLLRLPAFNVRDGLNDYDEDYTVFEPLGDTVTSDMKFHAERKRLQKEAEEAQRREEELRKAQAEEEQTGQDESEDKSAEMTTQDAEAGEQGAPQTDTPETDAPETDAPETDARERGSPDGQSTDDALQDDAPAGDSPKTMQNDHEPRLASSGAAASTPMEADALNGPGAATQQKYVREHSS